MEDWYKIPGLENTDGSKYDINRIVFYKQEFEIVYHFSSKPK